MKKLLLMKTVLLLCALVAGSSSVWADDDVTVRWTISGVATTQTTAGGGQVNTALSTSSITPSGASGTWTAYSSTATSYAGNNSGAQLGAAASKGTTREFNGTITLSNTSIPSDATIKSVTVNATTNGSTTLSATVGGNSLGSNKTINNSSATDYTISGSSQTGNSIVLTLSGTSAGKNVNIKAIVVVYTPPVETEVAKPKISLSSGTYWGTQSVTISTTTTDASIYYTTDGSVPSASNGTLYSSAISVTASQTIKAIGIKDGIDDSEVATAEYNIISSIPARNPKAINSSCFVKVTNVNELEDGDAVLIVNQDGNKAMGAQNSTKYREIVSVTSSAGVISNPSTAQKIVLIKAGNRFFFSTADNSYLYANSSSSNYINTGNATTAGANAMAAVEIEANGDASIDFMGANTRNSLRYNASDSRFSCYAPASSSLPVAQIYKEIEVPTSINVTISSSGYSTLAKAFGLDFSSATPVGLVAYVASEISASAVTLDAIDEAPASTGVILKGTAGQTYSIPVKNDASFDGTNKLKAAVTATTIAANEAYIMQGGLFHKVTAASSIPAGKAYLLTSDVPAAARELSFVFGGDETTGISTMHNSQCIMHNEYFDLQGRRVVDPTRGLYIVNGKKVVIK